MKTLRNTLLIFSLAILDTASLGAMEQLSPRDEAIENLTRSLLKSYNNPEPVLQLIQTLNQAYNKNFCVEIVKAALEKAGMLLTDIFDVQHNTILHCACSSTCSTGVITIILNTMMTKGELISAKNNDGKTAFDLAKDSQNEQIANMLDISIIQPNRRRTIRDSGIHTVQRSSNNHCLMKTNYTQKYTKK